MLSAQERAQVAQVWDLIAGHEAPVGAEVLLRWVGGARGCGARPGSRVGGARREPLTYLPRRLFTVYPSTKTYFPHLAAGADRELLLSHGRRMLAAVGVAVQHLDNLRAALSPLADLHAQALRVDPANFPLLIQCFQVVLASHLQDEFTVEMQAAWDKFLTGVSVVLTEKYR
ncbi:Hemoglobin subunit mu [Galemys pyrenaicus]|uniref:Hemoglobin subunit mu n=1 Tax=Galemys pyrenaicus TaxID=202257 RepID=A0A8J5ZY07_GALPY|nr:Hemoglobin subunit mu [Galemys pyrenaicus]